MELMSIGKLSEVVGLTQVYLKMLRKTNSKGHHYYSVEQSNSCLKEVKSS